MRRLSFFFRAPKLSVCAGQSTHCWATPRLRLLAPRLRCPDPSPPPPPLPRRAAHSPPAVSDAKMRFMQAFKRPLPGLYSTIVQELLVQQHLFRWTKSYAYSEVTALGIVSIFDQVLAGLPEAERALIFDAFVLALEEDPAQYRADAAKLAAWAAALPNGAADIKPDAGESSGGGARVRGMVLP